MALKDDLAKSWPLLTAAFFAQIYVFVRYCRELGISDYSERFFYLAMLSTLPYIFFFVAVLFVKGERRRNFAYVFLAVLFATNCFDWYYAGQTDLIKSIQSALWFFQLLFIIPFAMIVFGKLEKKPKRRG